MVSRLTLPEKYQVTPAARVIDWSESGSVAGTDYAVTADTSLDSVNVIELGGDVSNVFSQTLSAAVDMSAAHKITVKVSNSSSYPIPVKIMFCAGGSAIVRAEMPFVAMPGTYEYSGDTISMVVAGGFTWATSGAAINYIRMKQEPGGATAWGSLSGTGVRSINVGAIYQNKRMRPKLLFTFDDGISHLVHDPSGYPTGFPASGGSFQDILAYYGYVGTAYVVPGRINAGQGWDTQTLCTWEELEALQTAGWSIGSHSYTHPEMTGGYGFGMLVQGATPFGPITSISAATDTVTKTSHLWLDENPIVLGGSGVPSPLVAGETYYCIYVDANNFKVASSLANAKAGTAIDLTSDGDAANCYFGWPGADSTGDGVYNEFYNAYTELTSRGFTAAPHFAFPQGAANHYLIMRALAAARAAGVIKTTRAIGGGLAGSLAGANGGELGAPGTSAFGSAIPASSAGVLASELPTKISCDSGGSTTAQIKEYIDNVVKYGWTGCTLSHYGTAAGAVLLDYACSYAKSLEEKGMLDVGMNVEDWYAGLSGTRPVITF